MKDSSQTQCSLCGHSPKKSIRKPGFSEEGHCRSCFQRRQKFPNWTPSSVVSSIDYALFEAKDADGNNLPKKQEFEWTGLCGHPIKTSCHKEHTKTKRNGHPWHCASCSIKLEWADPTYNQTHKAALKLGHNKPESKARHSTASKENFKDPAFVSRHRAYTNYASIKRETYNGILFRSSWEVRIATLLDEFGLKWEYEKEYFSLPSLDNRGYIPDFYLPDQDLYLEVKGWYHEYAQAQHEAFVKDHQKSIVLIDKACYKQICQDSNYFKVLIHENSQNRSCITAEACS